MKCPACGREIDAASNIDPQGNGSMPGPGDLSICIGCATPLVFTDDYGLRLATEEEAKEIPARAIEAVRRVNAFRQALKEQGIESEVTMAGIKQAAAPADVNAVRLTMGEADESKFFKIDFDDPETLCDAILGFTRMICEQANLGPYPGLLLMLEAAILHHRQYCPTDEARPVFDKAVAQAWANVEENYTFNDVPKGTLQ